MVNKNYEHGFNLVSYRRVLNFKISDKYITRGSGEYRHTHTSRTLSSLALVSPLRI